MRPGVLFDVDGTLIDITYLHAASWWERLRPLPGAAELVPAVTAKDLAVVLASAARATEAAELREAGAVATYADPAALLRDLESTAIVDLK